MALPATSSSAASSAASEPTDSSHPQPSAPPPDSASSAASEPTDPSHPQPSAPPSDTASCLSRDLSESPPQRRDPLQFSDALPGDPLPANPARHSSDSQDSSSGTTHAAGDQKGHSKHSSMSAPAGEDGERTVTKRHSHTHSNVHTECGRHGDDWLLGGFSVTETVKQIFGKKQ